MAILAHTGPARRLWQGPVAADARSRCALARTGFAGGSFGRLRMTGYGTLAVRSGSRADDPFDPGFCLRSGQPRSAEGLPLQLMIPP